MFRSIPAMLLIVVVSIASTGNAQENGRFAAVLAKAKTALANGHQPADIRDFEISDLEKKIQASMDKPTTINAVDMPLDEVCDVISKMHGIPVMPNELALEEIGLTPDVPITFAAKNTKLRSVLRKILKQFDLTYQVDNSVLLFTTLEAAEQNLDCKMFKLPKILFENADAVIKAVKANVVPSTWETLGGPSSLTLVGDVLVVSATDDTVYDVSQFLGKLSKTLGN